MSSDEAFAEGEGERKRLLKTVKRPLAKTVRLLNLMQMAIPSDELVMVRSLVKVSSFLMQMAIQLKAKI